MVRRLGAAACATTVMVAALSFTVAPFAAAGGPDDGAPARGSGVLARSADVACETASAPATASILIVGDSVAQGSSGDWTWRYRLWRHLSDVDADVAFVGPRDDLRDRQAAAYGSHEYADADFDQHHAARWGMTFAEQDYPIGDLIASCRPDVIVEALGLNDLLWLPVSAQTVVDTARLFVADARAADPSIDVILGELPQTWIANVAAYNQGLAALADELDTPQARVVVAATGTGFENGLDTYEPTHLSATGEVKMAAGVADALAGLGVGAPYPRPLPHVDNGPTQPASLSLIDGDGESDLAWVLPAGATAVYVWVRDATIDDQWRRLPYPLEAPVVNWTASGLVNYHDYRFRLQAMKGSAVAEHLYSNVVKAWPHRRAPGRVRLSATSGSHRLTARWAPAKRATSYIVTWKRRGSSAEPSVRHTQNTRVRIKRLATGKRYLVTVTALNDQTQGRSASVTRRPR